ncbi:MAG: amidohydrolase [Thermoplasmatota archaeon]
MSIAIKDVEIIGRRGPWDVLIEDDKIVSISDEEYGDIDIDGSEKYLSPGFVNTHTHAAMSLFRGYADDLPLQEWLQEKIWPLEDELTEEHVYWGTKLACLEMIKTGTVAFNDMYFFMEKAAEAVREMGMKATLSYGYIDLGDKEKRETEIEKTNDFVDFVSDLKNIEPALGPHAVYTVSREGLEWAAEYSKKEDLSVHFHLAETKQESSDFKKLHDQSLTSYLDDVGLLNERLIAAHCVWLEKEDFERMKGRDIIVSHNPVSNMKLGVGKPMKYPSFKKNNILVTLGTDGCASNNNLDMLEEAKIAAIQQKMLGDSTVLPADEAFEMITKNGAIALKTGGGEIKEGKAADLILIEKDVRSVPGHNPISDLIYAMNGSSVTDVIIDGEVIMRERYVKGEEKIMIKASRMAKELVSEVN